MITEKIREQQGMFNAKCENIRWVLASHLAYSVLISRPDIVKLSNFPSELQIDNIKVSASDVFGVVLQPKDRQMIIDENLAAARRLLIADTFDQLVESFCRGYAIYASDNHADPYEQEDPIYFTGRGLYKGEKEARYFLDVEREFIKKLVNPLRNTIRHHNGIVPPKGVIDYQGQIDNLTIGVHLERGQPIRTDLNVCNAIFGLVRNIGNRAFERLIVDAQKV